MKSYLVSFMIVFGNGERRADTAHLRAEDNAEEWRTVKELSEFLNGVAQAVGGEFADEIRLIEANGEPVENYTKRQEETPLVACQ